MLLCPISRRTSVAKRGLHRILWRLQFPGSLLTWHISQWGFHQLLFMFLFYHSDHPTCWIGISRPMLVVVDCLRLDEAYFHVLTISIYSCHQLSQFVAVTTMFIPHMIAIDTSTAPPRAWNPMELEHVRSRPVEFGGKRNRNAVWLGEPPGVFLEMAPIGAFDSHYSVAGRESFGVVWSYAYIHFPYFTLEPKLRIEFPNHMVVHSISVIACTISIHNWCLRVVSEWWLSHLAIARSPYSVQNNSWEPADDWNDALPPLPFQAAYCSCLWKYTAIRLRGSQPEQQMDILLIDIYSL